MRSVVKRRGEGTIFVRVFGIGGKDLFLKSRQDISPTGDRNKRHVNMEKLR